MRRSIAIALIALSLGTIAAFFARRWMPPLASAEGTFFDHQFRLALAIVGVAFIAAQLALAAAVIRRKNSAADNTRSESRAELVWIGCVLLILTAFAITGTSALARTRVFAERETIHLEATGMQFQWYFRYPGADGVFGDTKPALIDASVGNPLGIDPSDERGRDDIVSAYAVVPVGHTVDIRLHAEDVIHSFFMPSMRVKQDAVPGLAPHVRFTPTKLGSYEVACAELCGIGHYRMFTRVNVVSEEEYARWLATHAPEASAQSTTRGAQ
jgi:cytochrome c oxidase subunit 2